MTSAQSDQVLRCPLTELLATLDIMKSSRVPAQTIWLRWLIWICNIRIWPEHTFIYDADEIFR